MADTLGSTIDSAVDSAVKSASTPEPAPASAAPAKEAASPATSTGTPAAASGSDAAPSTPASSGSPTTQGADDDAEVLRDSGWLNLDKRRTILENARTKSAAKERSIVLSTLGIPDDADLSHLSVHVRSLLADPIRYHQQLTESLRRSGRLPAETPATDPAPAPRQARSGNADGFKLPDPKYQTADGQGIYTQAEMQEIVGQMFEHIDAKLKPHDELAQSIGQERAVGEAFRLASTDLASAEKWRRFNDVRPRIAEIMREAIGRRDETVTLKVAYNQALLELEDKERPTLRDSIRSELLAEINKQPATGPVPAPGAPIVRQPASKKGKSLDQLFDEGIERAVAQAAAR